MNERDKELAEQAGFNSFDTECYEGLDVLIDLIRANEREACAKLCEENGKEPDDHKTYEGYDEGYLDGSNNCAAAIRARGNT